MKLTLSISEVPNLSFRYINYRYYNYRLLGKYITLWGERERGSVVGAVSSHRK